MNAVPGMPTRFWFTPTKTTAEMRTETGNPEFNYELVCNKICGKGHFAMKYLKHVVYVKAVTHILFYLTMCDFEVKPNIYIYFQVDPTNAKKAISICISLSVSFH